MGLRDLKICSWTTCYFRPSFGRGHRLISPGRYFWDTWWIPLLPYIDKRHVPRSRVLFFVSVSLDQGLILLFWHTISLPEGWYSQISKSKFLDSIWLYPRLSFFYCLAMRNTLEYAKRTLISSKLLSLSKLCPISGYVFGIGLHRGHRLSLEVKKNQCTIPPYQRVILFLAFLRWDTEWANGAPFRPFLGKKESIY